MERNTSVIPIILTVIAIISACKSPSETSTFVAPTSAPTPIAAPFEPVTNPPILEATATAKAAAIPSPTPTYVPRSSPTSTPTLKTESTTSTVSIPVSAQMDTFVSDVFNFSFAYPSIWNLDEINDQAITVKSPQDSAAVMVGIDILQSAPGIKDYTRLALDHFKEEFSTYRTISSTGTIVGELPGYVTFGELNSADETRTPVKIFTAVIGKMGFTLVMSSQDASFDRLEPLFDAIADSAKFPNGSFQPPSILVLRELISSDMDMVNGIPGGVGTVFEETTPALFAYLDIDYLPIDAELQFTWFRTDKNGTPIGLLGPITQEENGQGSVWSTFVAPEPIPLGFYLVAIFRDEELIAVMPFSVVIEDGAEFDKAQAYVDWSRFLLEIDDPVKAAYAATKALELDAMLTAAYINRAEALTASCEIDNAITDLSKALGLDPSNAELYSRRGTSHWITLGPIAALIDLNKAIELEPENAIYYNNRSLIQLANGRLDAALSDVNTALKLDPGSLNTLDSRGYIFLKAGQYRNAKQDYNLIINGGFEDSYTLLGAGLAYAGLGDDDLARGFLERGLALFSDKTDTCPDPQLSDLVQMAKDVLKTI